MFLVAQRSAPALPASASTCFASASACPRRRLRGSLAERVSEYQRVHGLKVTGIADDATIASLNLGPDYYLRARGNLERARRLPGAGQFGRYVLVDSAAAEVHLVNGDRIADSMRAIVGSPEHKTPMMAVMMQNAKVNPYWNVPPDLIRKMTAPRVLKEGVSYLKNFRYEVLADWNPASQPIDPATVNWNDVVAGKSKILVRQLPGPSNSMGAMKFEMPNRFGIYLHDTPKKELFASANRWVSNGCVRLEDAAASPAGCSATCRRPQGSRRRSTCRSRSRST